MARWLTLILAVAWSSAAGAQSEPTVVTTVDACVPVDLPHFRRLLSIELGTSIEYQPEAPRGPGQTWVHVSCAPAGIVLNLEDGLTGKSMTRMLDASEIEPTDSTRLLALAVAEFVVASWVELRAIPRPSVPALGAAPPSAATRVAEQTAQRKLAEIEPVAVTTPWELAVGLGLDTFTSHASVLATISLRFGVALPPIAFVLGGDAGFVDVPVVRDEMRVATIGVLRATGMGAVLFGGRLGAFSLWLGPGARFGVMRLSGESRISQLEASNQLDPQGGVMLLGRASYLAAEHFSVGLELEVGAVTLPVRASVGDSLLLEFSGAWFSAGLRFGLVF